MQGARRVETTPLDGSASFEAELDYVLRALRRHGVSDRDAEDLAQDVFLVMWRRRGDFDPGRPLRAWLAGIAFKVAHEHHKRSRRWWPREGLDPRDERPLPDEQLASARARALVLGALGQLSERQRAILVMHDLDGLAMPEIAALIRVPLFTGYSRLRLARKSFARAVEALRRHLPEAHPQTAVDLLEAERPAPQVAPEVRARAVSRMRALAAGGAPPRPAPAPSRAPWLAAAAVALLALGLVAGRAVRSQRAVLAPAASTSLARGLVGYWRFDDGAGAIARDVSGSGNDCRMRSGGGWTAGVVGGALALDGRAWLDCARAEPLARLDRELSIALWVKPDGGPGRQVFVARQLGDGRQDYFLLALNGDTLEAQSNLWASATKRRVEQPAGSWFHVAVVQKADGRRTLYVDGVPIGRSNKSVPAALGGGTNHLTIGGAINGRDANVADERFRGALDELALYDRALDEREVRALAAKARPN